MINMSHQWRWQLYEYRDWCVNLPRSHQRQPYLMNHNDGWWNRHTISPWSCSRLSWYSENEWTSYNSGTRPVGSGTPFIIASLAWSTERQCACLLSNHFGHGFVYGRLSFVHVHTFTSYTPLTRSPKTVSLEMWPSNRFGTDLIQTCSVPFHSSPGRILTVFSCRTCTRVNLREAK